MAENNINQKEKNAAKEDKVAEATVGEDVQVESNIDKGNDNNTDDPQFWAKSKFRGFKRVIPASPQRYNDSWI